MLALVFLIAEPDLGGSFTVLDVSPAKSTFRAATGAPGYDAIEFSAEPRATLLSSRDGPAALVHHLGLSSSGTAWATTHNPGMHVMLMNLSASGRTHARCGEFETEKPLRRGHVSFFPGQYTTELEFPACQSSLVLTMGAEYLDTITGDMGVVQAPPLLNERNDRLAQLIGMIDTEMRTPGFASALMVDGLLRAVATMLVRHEGALPGDDAPRIRLSPARLARVFDFIEQSLDGDVSLKDMAGVAGLSPFHFSRVFKLSTGETPYHYLGSRRLQRARVLLSEGKMPLAEMALACGFSSQSHFTAAFTKAMGVSPGRFRKMNL